MPTPLITIATFKNNILEIIKAQEDFEPKRNEFFQWKPNHLGLSAFYNKQGPIYIAFSKTIDCAMHACNMKSEEMISPFFIQMVFIDLSVIWPSLAAELTLTPEIQEIYWDDVVEYLQTLLPAFSSCIAAAAAAASKRNPSAARRYLSLDDESPPPSPTLSLHSASSDRSLTLIKYNHLSDFSEQSTFQQRPTKALPHPSSPPLMRKFSTLQAVLSNSPGGNNHRSIDETLQQLTSSLHSALLTGARQPTEKFHLGQLLFNPISIHNPTALFNIQLPLDDTMLDKCDGSYLTQCNSTNEAFFELDNSIVNLPKPYTRQTLKKILLEKIPPLNSHDIDFNNFLVRLLTLMLIDWHYNPTLIFFEFIRQYLTTQRILFLNISGQMRPETFFSVFSYPSNKPTEKSFMLHGNFAINEIMNLKNEYEKNDQRPPIEISCAFQILLIRDLQSIRLKIAPINCSVVYNGIDPNIRGIVETLNTLNIIEITHLLQELNALKIQKEIISKSQGNIEEIEKKIREIERKFIPPIQFIDDAIKVVRAKLDHPEYTTTLCFQPTKIYPLSLQGLRSLGYGEKDLFEFSINYLKKLDAPENQKKQHEFSKQFIRDIGRFIDLPTGSWLYQPKENLAHLPPAVSDYKQAFSELLLDIKKIWPNFSDSTAQILQLMPQQVDGTNAWFMFMSIVATAVNSNIPLGKPAPHRTCRLVHERNQFFLHYMTSWRSLDINSKSFEFNFDCLQLRANIFLIDANSLPSNYYLAIEPILEKLEPTEKIMTEFNKICQSDWTLKPYNLNMPIQYRREKYWPYYHSSHNINKDKIKILFLKYREISSAHNEFKLPSALPADKSHPAVLALLAILRSLRDQVLSKSSTAYIYSLPDLVKKSLLGPNVSTTDEKDEISTNYPQLLELWKFLLIQPISDPYHAYALQALALCNETNFYLWREVKDERTSQITLKCIFEEPILYVKNGCLSKDEKAIFLLFTHDGKINRLSVHHSEHEKIFE